MLGPFVRRRGRCGSLRRCRDVPPGSEGVPRVGFRLAGMSPAWCWLPPGGSSEPDHQRLRRRGIRHRHVSGGSQTCPPFACLCATPFGRVSLTAVTSLMRRGLELPGSSDVQSACRCRWFAGAQRCSRLPFIRGCGASTDQANRGMSAMRRVSLLTALAVITLSVVAPVAAPPPPAAAHRASTQRAAANAAVSAHQLGHQAALAAWPTSWLVNPKP